MWALGRLEGLGSEVDNPGAVFSSFVYKEAEKSSQVEGTAVTVSDIYRYEVDELQTKPRGEESEHEADIREARNYISALDEAVSFLQTAGVSRDAVTAELIKSIHGTLLESGRTDGDDPLPGEYRPGFAVIEERTELGGKRIRFVPPKAESVPSLMENLAQYIQSESTWPTLVDLAIIHYQFETIHPFKNGNGRTGRLLVALLLLASHLLHYPLLYLSSFIERHRTEYADLLLGVSERGEWEAWISFFLRGIREQATEAFVRGKLLLEQRREYETRYADAPKSVRRLARSLFEEPYFTVSEASETIGMVYQTANNAVDQLESDGVVSEITGNKQNRVFRADDIMDIVERPAAELPEATEFVDLERSWQLPT
jgi:Fic family protein